MQFEARLKNVGRLPVLVEKDLSLAGGNLKLNVIHPNGRVEVYAQHTSYSGILSDLITFCLI